MYETFENRFFVRNSETDMFGSCRASVLLSMLQDMATDHAAATDSQRERLLAEYNAVWLLARAWFRLDRPIGTDETLTVRTWQRGPDRLMVYRDFDLYVGEEPVGEAVTAWVVADVGTRRMLRPNEIPCLREAPVPFEVKNRTLKLIRTPKDREAAYTRQVRYSDLDLNGHMNNTKYADVAMDAFSPEELAGKFLSEMQINYSVECLPGQTLTVNRAETADGYYVDGCGADGARHFEAVLKFETLVK